MQDLIFDNIALIIFIPLWIFLIIMCGRFFSVYVNKFIVYILTLISSAAGAVICAAGLKYIPQALEWTHPFISINNFSLLYGLHIDKVSLIFGLILFAVSFCVQLFSISYMKEEKKSYRFFALLNLFNFGMSALIFSPNLYQVYFFWEIIGIISYLLIGFDYNKTEKSEASRRVFLTNRVGDTAFLGAIILISYIMYNYSGNYNFVTLSIFDFNAISTILYAYTSTPAFLIICGLLVLAAIVKSAQFPFHIWLQDAMEAKIPVSALLHSATLVAAGVYLVIRLLPFFTMNINIMHLITAIGLFTALVCSICASIETHPKKVLAYSTSVNLGMMFAVLGLENVKIAIIFFAIHAVIKSMLFLSLPREDNSNSYIRFGIFIIGALSLSGIVFAGVPAKELMYILFNSHKIISSLFLAICFINAFYITRLCTLIHKDSSFIKSVNIIELLSTLLLLGANIFAYIFLRKQSYEISLPFYISVFAIIAVLIMYKFGLVGKITRMPKIVEFISNKIIPKVYYWFANLANDMEKAIFMNYKPIISIMSSLVKLVNFVEKNIMERTVKGISKLMCSLSKGDLVMQSGNVQTYNAYAFILVTIVITIVIIGYTFIITYIGG